MTTMLLSSIAMWKKLNRIKIGLLSWQVADGGSNTAIFYVLDLGHHRLDSRRLAEAGPAP